MTRELKPCGTAAAYARHIRRREKPCDACRAARAAYMANWHTGTVSTYTPVRCGTNSGYVAHYRGGEKPCQPCREAHSAYQSERRAARRTAVAEPTRIRLSRKPGWRKPEGAVVVSRPSRWGNPFTITECLEDDPTQTNEEARARCVRLFEGWLKGELKLSGPDLRRRRAWILEHIGELAGKDLACWCYLDHPCHADVLLSLANGGRRG